MEANENNYPNRRKPWVAVFLTMVMPGLGHVYCGSIFRGILIMAVMAFFGLAWSFGMLSQNTPATAFHVIIYCIGFLASVVIAIDAYRMARRTRYDYKRKDYNHWLLYLALLWISGAGSIDSAAMVKRNIAGAYRITTKSMAPTIMKGDRAIADKTAYARNKPQCGDVVVFKSPENLRTNYIKRVVALSGDTIEVKNGKLLINDKPLETELAEKKTMEINNKQVEGDVFWETNDNARYQVFISKDNPQKGDFGPVKVPPYHCFVMGDNRNFSSDSRKFGTLSLGAIIGKFRTIYWPYQRRASLNTKK